MSDDGDNKAHVRILTQFFRQQGSRPREEFLEEFDGAFLLARFRGTTPLLVFLEKKEGFKMLLGSDEDCDWEFEDDPTLDPRHCEICYHPGFRGWTIEDFGSSFGTHVGNDRLNKERPTLLTDRSVIKPGGGLTELQFYVAETLYTRMTRAGITKSMTRKVKRESARQQPVAAEEAEDELDDKTPRPDE